MANTSTDSEVTEFFWMVAEPILERQEITRGTMMGFPCLRINGDFFASADHRTGDLIAKLPAQRVQELVASGAGFPFAPAGRTFKEWVRVTDRDETQWSAFLEEAQSFVTGL